MIYAVICLEANFLTWCPTTSLSSAISSGLCNISHVGNASLPFSCVLQFSSDPASLVRSFALDVLPSPPPFPPPLTHLPHNVDAIASSYQKTYEWLFTRCALVSSLPLTMDRWCTWERLCPFSWWPRFHHSVGLACAHDPLNFSLLRKRVFFHLFLFLVR